MTWQINWKLLESNWMRSKMTLSPWTRLASRRCTKLNKRNAEISSSELVEMSHTSRTQAQHLSLAQSPSWRRATTLRCRRVPVTLPQTPTGVLSVAEKGWLKPSHLDSKATMRVVEDRNRRWRRFNIPSTTKAWPFKGAQKSSKQI